MLSPQLKITVILCIQCRFLIPTTKYSQSKLNQNPTLSAIEKYISFPYGDCYIFLKPEKSEQFSSLSINIII